MQKSTILLASSLFALIPVSALATFPDVSPDHANYDAINYVQANGIVKGYPDGTFRPDQFVNRAEFLKIIIEANREKLLQIPIYGWESSAPAWTDSFCNVISSPLLRQNHDIELGSWYSGYACYGLFQLSMTGYPDGTFRPSAQINFVEAAKIAAETFHTGASQPLPLFENGPWYEMYVRYLESKKAIPSSVRSFDHHLTRGEMAEMIFRLNAEVTNKPSKTYDDLDQGNAASGSQDSTTVTVYLTQENESGICPDGSDGCYDLYVPVQVSVPKTTAKLRASLEALLNLPTSGNGCYGNACLQRSALYLSHLQVASATIVDGVAHVTLTGEQALAGDREGPRAVEQITRTVTQFSSVKSAEITLNGKSLHCWADLSGLCY